MRTMLRAIFVGCIAVSCALGSDGGGGADAVVARWMEAQGGRARLGAVRGFESDESIQYGAGGPSIRVHVVKTRSGHFRYETSNPAFGILVQAWDGVVGWQTNERLGDGLIAKADLGALGSQQNLLPAAEVEGQGVARRLLGDGEADGRRCKVVGITGPGGVEERFYFDAETGLCLREERPRAAHPEEMDWVGFSDYRPAGGLVVPFALKVVRASYGFTVQRSGVEIDPAIDEATFMISTARLVQIKRIEGILDRNLEAVGGDAIARIHSRVTRAELAPSGQMSRIRETVLQKDPDLILTETDTPGIGPKWTGFDGTVGWSSSEIEGFHLFRPMETAALRTFGKLSEEGRLGARFPLRRMLGPRHVDGRATHALVLSTFQVQAGTYYFDDETGRLLRLTSVFSDSDGHIEATQDYSDFRRVDGVEKPFVTTQTDPSGKSVETIVSIENNLPLDDSAFKPRRGEW